MYDLWHLRRQRQLPLDWVEVGRLLAGKADAYGLSYGGAEDFLDGQVLRGIQRDWRAQLANFVIDLPPFDRCVEDLRALVYELTG